MSETHKSNSEQGPVGDLDLQMYARKPFFVQVVEVTAENINTVAAWCNGDVRTMVRPGETKTERYVKVRVHLPLSERQTKAFVGDRVLHASTGFKVYPPNSFEKSFERVFERVEDT